MRFHQAFSTVANLGASICFDLANDKRFFFEEEAKMAKDFGDLMGCVVRKFRGGRAVRRLSRSRCAPVLKNLKRIVAVHDCTVRVKMN